MGLTMNPSLHLRASGSDRCVETATGRLLTYNSTPRLPKSTLLYGYHQARHLPHRGAVIVECPWGVLRVAQIGMPAIALLGTALSPSQRELLLRLPKVVLLLDGDQAGKLATEPIKAQLPNAIHVNLPEGMDPDDLSDEGLFRILAQTQRLPF